MDRMTKEQRHKCMSHIKSENTKPELEVRKFLYSNGIRYRLHSKQLPGKPDIAIKKYKIAIFVNGCFWHGHENCESYTMPKTNCDFWRNKIKHNQDRDIKNYFILSKIGWNTIVIWECQLKKNKKNKTLQALLIKINVIKSEWIYKKRVHKGGAANNYNHDFSYDIAAEEEAKYGEYAQ